MNFIRAHKGKILFFIVLVAVGVPAAFWWTNEMKSSNGVKYEIYEVKNGILERTVEAIGTLEPETTVNLSFEKSGMVAEVMTDVGSEVKEGDVLARLGNEDENASLKQTQASLAEASASLNLQLAKKPAEDVAIARAEFEQASADFNKVSVDFSNAKVTLANTKKTVEQQVRVAQLDMENAKLNLEKVESTSVNAGSGNLTAVDNSKDSLRDAIGQMLSTSSVAIQTVDKLFGVYGSEKFVESSDFSGEGGQLYSASWELLISNNIESKTLESEYRGLPPDFSVAELQDLAEGLSLFIQSVRSMVLMAVKLLDHVITRIEFDIADLNQYRTELNTVSANFDASVNGFNSAKSALYKAVLDLTGGDVTLPIDVSSAKLLVEQKQQAWNSAKIDGETQVADAESKVNALRAQMDVQRALINRSQFALDRVQSSPRDVDTAPYRARVAAAAAAVSRAQSELNKTYLSAPIAGIVSLRDTEAGEQVTGGMGGDKVAFRVIDKEAYHIDVDVPETQIDKINMDSKVEVDFDAFEEGKIFEGQIVSMEPAATIVDGIVYYRVKVMLKEKDARMKPGMTVNVRIIAEPKKDALIVPERAVLKLEGKKAVMVINGNGQPEEVEVRVGVKGNNGIVEIIGGLNAGQKIIVNWSWI